MVGIGRAASASAAASIAAVCAARSAGASRPPLLEIRAGTEGALARPGYDDRPDILLARPGLRTLASKLCRELPADGIEGLGSVEGQRGDVTFAVDG